MPGSGLSCPSNGRRANKEMGFPERPPPKMHLGVVASLCCSVVLLVSMPSAVDGELQILQVGALLSNNTTIGRVAMGALQLAVQEVNANASILSGYELVLQSSDSQCNAFFGADAAVRLLNLGVVAVAGPQTSVVAPFVADIGAAAQVPFVSYSATDPSLTAIRNPYFLRTVHSDQVTMDAIAYIIGHFAWRTVAGISTDDNVGLNGLSALEDGLVQFGSAVVFKSFLEQQSNQSVIAAVLTQLAQLETRVFVVHLQLDLGRLFFSTAKDMSMMTSGFVWIVSEALASVVEDLPGSDPLWLSSQGVIGVRSHIPASAELTSFQQRWNSLEKNVISLSSYGVYAYDTMWLIARAMDTFLKSGKTFDIAQSNSTCPPDCGIADSLRVRLNGEAFLQTIKNTQFMGLSGPIALDSRGDLVDIYYDVVNLIGKSARVVGYWRNDSGFSAQPFLSSSTIESSTPLNVVNNNVNTAGVKAQLQDIIWPGGSAEVPKGWTVPKDGKPLLIGVPHKEGFQQFVDVQYDSANGTTFDGFCIAVFRAAVGNLPYPLNYTFVAFGNGTVTPSYDELIQNLVDGIYDGVVGDVTILETRAELVDFTQPFISSGLVVLVPQYSLGTNHPWAFMRPFTPGMWVTTGIFFLFTGLCVWILEHKKNRQFRGRPKKQVVTVLWFTFSTLFFAQKEDTKSTLGRAVLVIWLFVVLIINSSYTASLSSILTVQQLQPTIQNIAGLVDSTVSIGYQSGSFVYDYLIHLNVAKDRLLALSDETAFADALGSGLVGAIVDELPYVEMFLETECDYTIAGQEFTKNGWGFAFPKGSQLTTDISTAILGLSDSGELQQLHDYWLSSNDECGGGISTTTNELGLGVFWGLFIITGAASILCVILYYARLIWQHHKSYKDDDADSEQSMSRSSRRRSFLRSLVSYIEEAEVTRDEDLGGQNSLRRHKAQKRSLEFDLEDGSARLEHPGLTSATTPDHPTNNAY